MYVYMGADGCTQTLRHNGSWGNKRQKIGARPLLHLCFVILDGQFDDKADKQYKLCGRLLIDRRNKLHTHIFMYFYMRTQRVHGKMVMQRNLVHCFFFAFD